MEKEGLLRKSIERLKRLKGRPYAQVKEELLAALFELREVQNKYELALREKKTSEVLKGIGRNVAKAKSKVKKLKEDAGFR